MDAIAGSGESDAAPILFWTLSTTSACALSCIRFHISRPTQDAELNGLRPQKTSPQMIDVPASRQAGKNSSASGCLFRKKRVADEPGKKEHIPAADAKRVHA